MGHNSGAEGASWQQDPFGRHDERWWDGDRWTERVRTAGATGIDPPGIDAQPASLRASERVGPIVDATGPVELASPNLPKVLLGGVVLLLVILALVLVGVLTA